MKKQISILALILLTLCSTGSQAQIGVVVSLTGTVVNEVSGQPCDVTMEVRNEKGKKFYKKNIKAVNKGEYFLTGLKPGKTYKIDFFSFNYFKQEYIFSVPNTRKYAEFSRDFTVKPKAKGIKLKLRVPPFELNKSKIRAGSDFFLADMIKTLKFNRKIKFKIACYPDNDLDPAKNQIMTTERANNLKDFFVKSGVKINRIEVAGFDKTDPHNPPPTLKRAKGKRYIGITYIEITDLGEKPKVK